ncbi:hypothetical protein J6590_085223 [Homalodisca vitripennis]|nr:hypothetical protein J6590_085223 [Homalodisca vitripennis]
MYKGKDLQNMLFDTSVHDDFCREHHNALHSCLIKQGCHFQNTVSSSDELRNSARDDCRGFNGAGRAEIWQVPSPTTTGSAYI